MQYHPTGAAANVHMTENKPFHNDQISNTNEVQRMCQNTIAHHTRSQPRQTKGSTISANLACIPLFAHMAVRRIHAEADFKLNMDARNTECRTHWTVHPQKFVLGQHNVEQHDKRVAYLQHCSVVPYHLQHPLLYGRQIYSHAGWFVCNVQYTLACMHLMQHMGCEPACIDVPRLLMNSLKPKVGCHNNVIRTHTPKLLLPPPPLVCLYCSTTFSQHNSNTNRQFQLSSDNPRQSPLYSGR